MINIILKVIIARHAHARNAELNFCGTVNSGELRIPYPQSNRHPPILIARPEVVVKLTGSCEKTGKKLSYFKKSLLWTSTVLSSMQWTSR